MKTVAVIHTATPMVEPTQVLFARHLPGVRLFHLVDETLIGEVIEAGRVRDETRDRLLGYYRLAAQSGADLIFNTCSSVGEVVREARTKLRVPLVKIDEPMAEEAVTAASRIGVLATLQTTLYPTVRLLRSFAEAHSKEVQIRERLAEGAFESARSGDLDRHDHLIMESASEMMGKVDLLVLAQGSMARLEKQLEMETGMRVLSSPERAVLKI